MRSPESSSIAVHGHRRSVSTPLVLIITITFALGLGLGGLIFAWRSPEPVPHHPADNLIIPHLVIGALVLGAAVALTLFTRSLRWTAVLISARTGARIAETFRRGRSLTGALRCVAFVLLAVFVLYLVLRMGWQATAGLDPNVATNAWGGPTAVGAFAAHGVDALVCIGVACILGHLVLRKEAG